MVTCLFNTRPRLLQLPDVVRQRAAAWRSGRVPYPIDWCLRLPAQPAQPMPAPPLAGRAGRLYPLPQATRRRRPGVCEVLQVGASTGRNKQFAQVLATLAPRSPRRAGRRHGGGAVVVAAPILHQPPLPWHGTVAMVAVVTLTAAGVLIKTLCAVGRCPLAVNQTSTEKERRSASLPTGPLRW